jgi:hypothetical protein
MQMRGADVRRLIQEAMESSSLATNLRSTSTSIASLTVQNARLYDHHKKSRDLKKIGTFGVALLAGPLLAVSLPFCKFGTSQERTKF